LSTIPRAADAVDVPMPPAWRAALAAMQAMRAERALAHLWDARDHAALSTFDGVFRTAVRIALTESVRVKRLKCEDSSPRAADFRFHTSAFGTPGA